MIGCEYPSTNIRIERTLIKVMMNGRSGQHVQSHVVTVNKHELGFVLMDLVLIHCMKVVRVNMMDVSISSIFFIFEEAIFE